MEFPKFFDTFSDPHDHPISSEEAVFAVYLALAVVIAILITAGAAATFIRMRERRRGSTAGDAEPGARP